ncbi:hypothetical protein [uncultured Oscillibacter sp.]|uniref:hypothetical protein n=1 Tax=uncultured Oscillibacter sp. TaxID=876091 RepID=UPI0028049776|nr:hypothetical protein [uncultured Oscillibacter sp.]
MRDNDAILALLDDIKELLFGIALLLLAGILSLLGVLLGGWALLLPCCSVFIGLEGLLSVCRGHDHHKVVEKQD